MCELTDTFRSLTNTGDGGFAIGIGQFHLGKFEMASGYDPDFQSLYMENGWVSRDPVVTNCAGKNTSFLWGVDCTLENEFIRRASDFGLRFGTSPSSFVSGSSCTVSIAGEIALSETARTELDVKIRQLHIEQLATRALTLTETQIAAMKIFPHGMRAKQVASEFSVTEDAVKLRKQRILSHIGINGFATAVHLCAVAGVTVH